MIFFDESDILIKRMFTWAKDPSLIMDVAIMIFIVLVVNKKERLTLINAVIFCLTLLSFIFGRYGVPKSMLF